MGTPKGNSRNVLDIRMGNESMNDGFSVAMFDYQRATDEINRISLAINGIYPYLSWFGRCNTLSLSISYDCEDWHIHVLCVYIIHIYIYDIYIHIHTYIYNIYIYTRYIYIHIWMLEITNHWVTSKNQRSTIKFSGYHVSNVLNFVSGEIQRLI